MTGVYSWDPWSTIYSSTVRIRHGFVEKNKTGTPLFSHIPTAAALVESLGQQNSWPKSSSGIREIDYMIDYTVVYHIYIYRYHLYIHTYYYTYSILLDS